MIMAIIPIDPSLDLTEFTATGSINNMIKRSGEFKNLLIRTMLDRSAINANEIQSYLGAINSFLRSWSDYAEKLADEMSNAKVKNGAIITSILPQDKYSTNKSGLKQVSPTSKINLPSTSIITPIENGAASP